MIRVIKPLIIPLYRGWFLHGVSSLCCALCSPPFSIDLHSPLFPLCFICVIPKRATDETAEASAEMDTASLVKWKCERWPHLAPWLIVCLPVSAPVCPYLFITLHICRHNINVSVHVHVCNDQHVFLHASCWRLRRQSSSSISSSLRLHSWGVKRWTRRDECVAPRCVTATRGHTPPGQGVKYKLTAWKVQRQHFVSELKEDGWVGTAPLVENRSWWKCILKPEKSRLCNCRESQEQL